MEIEKYKRMYDLEDSYWWFVAKHKIVRSVIRYFYGEDTAGAYALDIGCGTGAFLDKMEQMDMKAYGLDMSREAVDFCRSRRKSRLLVGNVEGELPFRDNAFDIVTSLDVIEHVDDYRRVIEEACRVLRPGGILVITVPAFQFLWNQHDEVHHHKRRFVSKDIKAAIESTGDLRTLKLSYYNFFLFFVVCLFRILKKTFRWNGKRKDDFISVPRLVNGLLCRIFSMESLFLKHLDFPFGVSIIAVARKGLR